MHILFLTTRLPFPPVGGERLRPFYIIKHFPADWRITVVSFLESESEKELLKDVPLHNIRIRTVILPRYKSYIKCLSGIFSRRPLEINYYASKQMQRIIQEEMHSFKYDLIFCHLLRMAPYVENYYTVKKVLDMTDALSLRYALSSHFRRGPFKLVEWIESRRLMEYEPQISAKFDLNLVASFADKIYLEQNLGIKRLEVVECGIEWDNRDYRKIDFRPNKIVFFGNLRTFHNIDAVMYFYKKILPLVKRKIRDVEFIIVGANIPRYILELKKDSYVSVFKDVSDIRPFIEDACVSVAPMRIAVGIQDKILQAMAFGVPVVTTSRGLGGIQAEPDKDILIADTPFEFADKIVALMQDRSLRGYIRENAYNLVHQKYLWSNISSNLNKKLINLLENKNP